MSLSEALGPIHVTPKLEPVGNNPAGSDDVEMNVTGSTLVPKTELDRTTPKEDAEMEDLFGNDDDLDAKGDDDEMKGQSSGFAGSPVSSRQGSEERQRRELEYEEPDEPADVVLEEVKEADVPIPNLPVPRSSDGNHWVIRMPNFVKVDAKPFHPDAYMGPEHDDDDSQQGETLRERSMSIKLRVENTVRWRWIKDEYGQDIRQSNARVIRWSDGTLSLRLGKELFDINQSIDTSGAVPRGSLGGSQSQSQVDLEQPGASISKAQGLTYLVAQHKRAQLLQSEAIITGYMTLRPTGMQSETHRMLVRAVGQKHNKVARLRMAPDPTMDPEKEVAEMAKNAAKKSRKKAEIGEHGGRKRRSGHKKRTADVWSDDDEEPEYGSEEEEEDMSRKVKAKSKSKKDEEKGGKGDYEEDDFVVADSTDEDEDDAGGKKRKRARAEEEEDPLDRMEAKLREQDREEKSKRQKKGGARKASFSSDAEDDAAMEVESEEEEDEGEFKVRRTGTTTGSRKKRAIDFDDDEDEDE